MDNVAPDFCKRYDKPALYFSLPTLFPDHVGRVRHSASMGGLYLVTPFTQAERNYFSDYGAIEFEKLLARSGVDRLEFDRPSAV